MNQKLAKKLRRIATQMATAELSYIEKDNVKKEVRTGLDGRLELVDVKYQGTIVCHPNSARAIYQHLKKHA